MSSIFSRLAIGTANFGKEYNGSKVSEDDVKRILDYCQCSGIDMLDCATAYEWDWTQANSYFNVAVKINENDSIARLKEIKDSKPYCIMCHHAQYWMELRGWMHEANGGISFSDPSEYTGLTDRYAHVFEVPYSMADRRFESNFTWMQLPPGGQGNLIFVRSIFLGGKLLKKFKPWECIAFCLMNPKVNRVIIGVDSYQQLKDNLRLFHRMEAAKIKDENILDPRKWTD